MVEAAERSSRLRQLMRVLGTEVHVITEPHLEKGLKPGNASLRSPIPANHCGVCDADRCD